MNGLLATAGFGPVSQQYLSQARQMQALSLAVHIPLVCFGIAFPAMVLFAEWRYLRTGDLVYLTIARRWSKVMLALFAVGVVTGTILSFELGLLWPAFMARFGSVFGLGFTLEGFSFFVEAIFIAIYVYGWDRLRPRLHFASGIPDDSRLGLAGSARLPGARPGGRRDRTGERHPSIGPGGGSQRPDRLAYSWKHFIGGHLGRLGTRDDLTLHQQYMADIAESSKKAIDSVDYTPYFAKYPDNPWAAFRGGLNETIAMAAAPVIEKYTGVLAAADVFTESTTFQVLQSIRLDLGYGSWVHP